jgi:hypothetical protein
MVKIKPKDIKVRTPQFALLKLALALLILLIITSISSKFLLSLFSRTTGDVASACDVHFDNSRVDELQWKQGIYKFFYLSKGDLFSQLSNSSTAQVVLPGKIESYRLVKGKGKIVFIQNGKLSLIDEDGKNKKDLLTLPNDKYTSIHGFSNDNTLLLIALYDKDPVKQRNRTKDDLRIIDLLSSTVTTPDMSYSQAIAEYDIERIGYPVQSTSDDGQRSIQLKGGSFQINNKEAFYCGVVRGTLQASGPACFQHYWLPDNDHVVVDLCGAVIVEASTNKIVRLNSGSSIEWYKVD